MDLPAFRFNITAKVFLLIIFASVVPILLYSGITISQLSNLEINITNSTTTITTDSINDHITQVINITESQISSIVENDIETIKTLSRSLSIPLFNNDSYMVSRLRIAVYKVKSNIGGIWVVNKSNMICSGPSHPYFEIGTDLSNDTVHQGILNLIDKNYNFSNFPPVIFNPYPVGNGSYGMGYDFPIFYNDTYIGVVIMTREWNQFQDVILSTKIKESGHLMVINGNGDILAGYYTNETQPYEKNLFQLNPSFVSSQSILEKNMGLLEGTIEDKKIIFAFKWIEAINSTVTEYQLDLLAQRWAIVLAVPLEEFITPIEAIKNEVHNQTDTFGITALLCLVLLVVLGLVFATYGSSRTTAPLLKLIDASEQISKGNLETRVLVTSNDEIGDLGIAFNQMAENLYEFTNHLEELVNDRTKELTETNSFLSAIKERLAVTLRSINDGVISTDIDGRVQLVNSAAEEITGWNKSEIKGKLFESITILDEGTGERIQSPVRTVLRTKLSCHLSKDTIIVAPNDVRKVVSISTAPIKDKKREIIGVVLVLHDITRKKRVETELLKIHKLESVGILAAGIAHDFNNILTIIQGNIALSKLYDSDPTLNQYLTKVEEACNRAEVLTRRFLIFSRGGAPVRQLDSLKRLFKDIIVFALSGSNINHDISIPEDLWLVEVDSDQISQVINNLVLNARDSMSNGGIIKVEAQNLVVNENEMILPLVIGNYIVFSIKDQGIGISQENLKKIFDPFFTTKPDSTGLGLTTSYYIISKHQGCMIIDSNEGVGTTVRVYLPASKYRELVKEKKEPKTPIKGKKGRILLMDDEKELLKVTSRILENLGYTTETACDGEEAIEKFVNASRSDEKFDAIIMDLTIPGGMGGKETVKHLLKIDPNVRAVVSSGYSNDPVMANYEKYGFSGLLPKPYSLEEIDRILQEVVVEKE